MSNASIQKLYDDAIRAKHALIVHQRDCDAARNHPGVVMNGCFACVELLPLAKIAEDDYQEALDALFRSETPVLVKKK